MALMSDRIMVVIDAASSGAVQELQSLEKSAKTADDGVINLGKSLKTGLVAGAAALAGTGLVSFLNDSAQAFAESQQAALQFGRATNATVEEAGKFTTVARQLGLDMNDLIEINAEFSKKIAEQPQLLADIGVEISRNADGSVNMTRTLVETIDALGSMEDGLKAAQTAATLFGEEGSKQLAGFYLQGINVADLMDRIDFVDKSEDAKRYAASTLEMNLAMEQLQITLGAAIVPLFSDLADIGTTVLGFLTDVPVEVYAAVGAFVALRAVNAVGLISGIAGAALDAVLNFGVLAAEAGGAKLAMEKLNAVVAKAGPWLALAAAVGVYISAVKEIERVQDFISDVDNVNQSLEEQAKALEEGESWWNRFVGTTETKIAQIALETHDLAEARLADASASKAEKEAAQELLDVLGDDDSQWAFRLETERGHQAQIDFARALEGTASVLQGEYTDSFDNLNDAVADFVMNGENSSVTLADISRLAGEAAENQKKQEAATRLADEALAAYNWTLQDTVDKLLTIEGFEGSGIENLKARLEGLDFSDNPETWANEWKIAAENARTYIFTELSAALEADPDLDTDAWFASLIEDAPPAAREAILKAKHEFDQANLDLKVDPKLPDKGTVDTEIEGIVPGQRDLTINPKPGDFTTVTSEIDTVTEDRTALVEIDITNNIGAGWTLDMVANPGGKHRKAYIDIDITNNRGASWTLDQVANPNGAHRIAYIDVVTRGSIPSGTSGTSGGTTTQGASQNRAELVQPIVNNSLRVNLDGQQLRGVVREEVRYASTSNGTAVP